MDAIWVEKDRIAVDVRVINRTDRTLLVVDEVRSIQWHEDSRTLELWLCSRGGASAAACRAASLPTTKELASGAEASLRLHVPRKLWRLEPREKGNPEVTVDDLSHVVMVVVHVGIADTPFYHAPSGPPAREQLKAWHQIVSGRGIRPTEQ